MLSAHCSHRLFLHQNPVLASPITVFNRRHTALRSTRTLSVSANRNRKVLCFKHDEFASEDAKPEIIRDPMLEEFVKPRSDVPTNETRDWTSSLQEAVKVLFREIGKPWTVPWTAETIIQVTLLWIASFWCVGTWIMPLGAHMAGFGKTSLTHRGHALYSLLTDITEGLAGVAIISRCLSRFRPLPSGWFSFSLRGNWLLDVALGCLMFPIVNRLSQFNIDLIPISPSAGPVAVSAIERSIAARDPVAMAVYAAVVAVCAPVWEEILFRGFLLPSLTKYMPVWCAIVASSVGFAMAHINVQRMMPLVFLGLVMGAIYARTRNLLPSMVLHSLWNAFVFFDLMK